MKTADVDGVVDAITKQSVLQLHPGSTIGNKREHQ